MLQFFATLSQINAGSNTRAGLFRSHPDTDERVKKANKQIKKNKLDDGVWVEERYAQRVPYERSDLSTGGPAVDGARGMAGADQDAEDDDSEEASSEEPEKKGGRFSLAQLASNPFDQGAEKESAEVTGAGAGRAVGEEADELEEGPKDPALVDVEITPEDLDRFRREGGLR